MAERIPLILSSIDGEYRIVELPDGDTVPGSGGSGDGATGPTGPTGPIGPQGSLGAQGVVGPQGDQGNQGSIGPQGSLGAQGVAGPQGSQGADGPQGAGGPQGTQGPQGAQGVDGPQGAQGLQGSQGDTGPQGAQGVDGPQGAQGLQGVAGPQGDQGVDGPQGAQGLQGSTGPQGDQGVDGPQGAQGLQGVAGPQGAQGVDGPQGAQGLQGVQGPQGTQGVDGPQGVGGPQGAQGDQGAQGTQGAQGDQGPTGAQGAQGSQGAQGDTGATGPTGPGRKQAYLFDVVNAGVAGEGQIKWVVQTGEPLDENPITSLQLSYNSLNNDGAIGQSTSVSDVEYFFKNTDWALGKHYTDSKSYDYPLFDITIFDPTTGEHVTGHITKVIDSPSNNLIAVDVLVTETSNNETNAYGSGNALDFYNASQLGVEITPRYERVGPFEIDGTDASTVYGPVATQMMLGSSVIHFRNDDFGLPSTGYANVIYDPANDRFTLDTVEIGLTGGESRLAGSDVIVSGNLNVSGELTFDPASHNVSGVSVTPNNDITMTLPYWWGVLGGDMTATASEQNFGDGATVNIIERDGSFGWDTANDRLNVSAAGIYRVQTNFQTIVAASQTITMKVYVNAVEKYTVQENINAATDPQMLNLNAVVQVATKGDYIRVTVNSPGSDTHTCQQNSTLYVERIG